MDSSLRTGASSLCLRDALVESFDPKRRQGLASRHGAFCDLMFLVERGIPSTKLFCEVQTLPGRVASWPLVFKGRITDGI